MPRHSVSASSEHKNPILFKIDSRRQRERALWHYHKPTKAEKNFLYLYENPKIAAQQKNELSKKDILFIHNLDKEYMALQIQIQDEHNVDVQQQRNWIDQQHDILEEQEKVYNKYYKNGTTSNK